MPALTPPRPGPSTGATAPPFKTSPETHLPFPMRSEEHTSELQSPCNLVCRLLLEKKKNEQIAINYHIKFNMTIQLQQLNVLQTLVIIMMANQYAFLHISRNPFLKECADF